MSAVSAEANETFAARIARLCDAIAMLALIVIAAVQLWQVIARYLLNQSLAWSEPLSSLLLSILMSFAAASAVYESRHFRFSWLLDQFPKTYRTWLDRVINLTISGACLAISIKAATWAMDGIAVKQAGIALPVGSNYVPLALAMLLAFLFSLVRLLAKQQETGR